MQSATPEWVLSIAYWLHMLATVVWIGGLAALSLIVIPSARKALDAGAYSALLTAVQARLQWLGWFSLVVLFGTGMFQMSAHPSYEGFLSITNNWAVAIFSKHLAVGLMIITSAYATWGLLPALRRLSLLRAAGREIAESQLEKIRRREMLLLNINIALSLVILGLTAWARVSG